METSIREFPVYAKLSIITIGLIGVFYILFIGREILIPLVFATIIAILLNPVVNYLCIKKLNRILAIFIALSAAIFIIGLWMACSYQFRKLLK